MPKRMDPNSFDEIFLDSDAHISAADRPVFMVKTFTGREQLEYASLTDQLNQSDSNLASFKIMFRLLGMFIIGWRNMSDGPGGETIPFDVERLPDIIDAEEAIELMKKHSALTGVSTEDLGKSESASSCSMDGCAATVHQDVASIAPPSTNLPSSAASPAMGVGATSVPMGTSN